LDLDWIVEPLWKVNLDLDCQPHFCDGCGLNWQSKKSDWATACPQTSQIEERFIKIFQKFKINYLSPKILFL